jgi:hypothetical protein
MSDSPYETDFHAWIQQQAESLKKRDWNNLDIPNLVEELESLGRSERRELKNRLAILLGHLLKWQFQPGKRTTSWSATIKAQRLQILQLLKDSPSLKSYLGDAVGEAYQIAINLAVSETGLSYSVFPSQCPYTIDQSLESEFLPE